MKLWLIILGSSIVSYLFVSLYLSYLLVALLLYVVLRDLYVIQETKFNLGTIKESYIFYSKVKGPYKDLSSEFKKYEDILKKFKLEKTYEYNLFGFYYDDPKKVKEEECRSIVGIIYTPSERDFPVNKELEDFLLNDTKATKAHIPPTAAIVSRFNLVELLRPMSIVLVILRYFKDLERNLCDKEFVSKMRFDPEKLPGIMEMYKGNIMEFCLPTGNQDKFKLYE